MKITVKLGREEVNELVRAAIAKEHPGRRIARVEPIVAGGYYSSDPREPSHGPELSGYEIDLA